MATTRTSALALAAVLASFIASAYFPVHRLYFHSDDFEWLRAAADALRAASWQLPDDVNGHFRPAAELTWMVGYRWFGMQPLGYYVIALSGHFVASLAVAYSGARLAGSTAAGFAAGLLFAVNFGHRGALTWLSAAPDRWQGALLAVAVAAALAGARYRLVVVVAVAGALLAKESAMIALIALPLVAPGWFAGGRWSSALLVLVVAALSVPHLAAVAVSSYAQQRFAVGAHGASGLLRGLSELLAPSATIIDGGAWSAWVGPQSWARQGVGLALLLLIGVLAARRIGRAAASRWLLAVAATLLLPALSRDGVESRWLYLTWTVLAPLAACGLMGLVDGLPVRCGRRALVGLLGGHVVVHGALLHLKLAGDATRDRWVRGVIEGASVHPPPLREIGRVQVQVPFGAELRAWPVGLALALQAPELELVLIDDRTSPMPSIPLLDATSIPSRWVADAR